MLAQPLCWRGVTLASLLASHVLFVPGLARAATYLVLSDGSGDFPTIQSAIDAASTGDVIELGDGTFVGPGNRDNDYGGREIVVRSRSGSPDLCVVDCAGSPTDPHRGFVFLSGEGPGAVLEGITITGGYEDVGGAMKIADSGPTIRDCVFAGNAGALSAGAVRCSTNTTARFRGCVFRENRTIAAGSGAWGGAATVLGNGSSVEFVDCRFENNQCGDGGGAVAGFQVNLAPIRFEGCTFLGNGAGSAGAIALVGTGSCTTLRVPVPIVDCEFVDNVGAGAGGAIWAAFATLGLERCLFDGNRTLAADRGGGAVYLSCGTLHCTETDFLNNVGATGGAIYFNGNVGQELRLADCRFIGNQALGPTFGEGGAVHSRSNSPLVFADDCVFHDNIATHEGGALAIGHVEVARCTFVDNVPSAIQHNGPASTVDRSIIVCAPGSEAILCDGPTPTLTVTCSDLFSPATWPPFFECVLDGGQNFFADPLFCDPGRDDFTLQADSPCAPPGVTACGLVGALPVACGPIALQPDSWGAIKAHYWSSGR